MRVIVIGATGTIGKAVAEALEGRHEVLRAARKSGDVQVDITSNDSIAEMYRQAGRLDAVICCAGEARFKPLDQLADDDFEFSLDSKLMGQVNLVLAGMRSIADGGSFTLTSGVLAREPMRGSGAITPVNAAVEAFALAAAGEVPRGVRVNVVSPPWVSETLVAMGQDPSGGMPAAEVARAYVAALEGTMNGATLDARDIGGGRR